MGVEADIVFGRLDDSSQRAGQEAPLDLVEVGFLRRLLHAVRVAERRPRKSAASAGARGVVGDDDSMPRCGGCREVKGELGLEERVHQACSRHAAVFGQKRLQHELVGRHGPRDLRAHA